MSVPSDSGAAAPAAAAAATPTPAENQPTTTTTNLGLGSKEEGELLSQADRLKQQTEAQARELDYLRRYKADLDSKYEAEREPQFKKYVDYLEAKQGSPLPADQKKVLHAAFCKQEYKADGDRMWREFQDSVAVAASKKALEAELAAVKAERDRLAETQTKLTQSLGPAATRASYAAAIAVPDVSAAVQASAAGGVRKEPMQPSLSLNEVMGAAPSATEIQLGFLQEYNFPTEFGVRASGAGGKQLRMTGPAAPEHPLLLDSHGERNFPASMRYQHPLIFGRYTNDRSYLDGDSVHANVVVRNAERTYEQSVNDLSVRIFPPFSCLQALIDLHAGDQVTD